MMSIKSIQNLNFNLRLLAVSFRPPGHGSDQDTDPSSKKPKIMEYSSKKLTKITKISI